MDEPRAGAAEKAYWRKVAAASALLEAESSPAASLDDVFEQMAAIRNRLGSLAAPGLPPDDDSAIAENLAIRARFLERERRGR